jgi:hypothetical protein
MRRWHPSWVGWEFGMMMAAEWCNSKGFFFNKVQQQGGCSGSQQHVLDLALRGTVWILHMLTCL